MGHYNLLGPDFQGGIYYFVMSILNIIQQKKKSTFLLFIMGCIICWILYYVPPVNPMVIFLFINLISFWILLMGLFISDQRNAITAAILVFLLLTLNAIIGFNVLNSALLISFVLGVRFLLQ